MMSEDILFIEELIEWIEINLEKRPTLDDVAKISGYSKWHLQRKFKSIVGLQLASYIRGRVLTRAAVALRISRKPIITISDELDLTRNRPLHVPLHVPLKNGLA